MARQKTLRRKRPRMPAEERKQQIIQAATELFSRHGFRGTTTRQLARRAGISEAMIYRHFPSKEALYDAMLQKKIKEIRHLYFPVEAARAKQDRAVLETVLGNFVRQQTHDDAFMRMLLFSALEGHKLAHKFVQGPLQEFFQFLSTYLDKRMQDGAFKPVNPDVAARLLLGMVFYLVLLKKIYMDPKMQEVHLEDFVQTTVDLFQYGIGSLEKAAGQEHRQ